MKQMKEIVKKVVKGNAFMGRNRVVFKKNGRLYAGTLAGITDSVYIRSACSKPTLLFPKKNLLIEDEVKSFNDLKDEQVLLINSEKDGSKFGQTKEFYNIANNTPNAYWQPDFKF